MLPLVLLTGTTTTTIDANTIMDILKAVTDVFSITQIVTMIAGILGVTMAFVFLWWGVRKAAKAIIRAVTSGKFSI